MASHFEQSSQLGRAAIFFSVCYFYRVINAKYSKISRWKCGIVEVLIEIRREYLWEGVKSHEIFVIPVEIFRDCGTVQL